MDKRGTGRLVFRGGVHAERGKNGFDRGLTSQRHTEIRFHKRAPRGGDRACLGGA